jgi:hypothetical protein
LTILGSIFVGALLVTNLFLGHWLLREEVTVTKVVGSLLVLGGSIVVIAATPSGVPTCLPSGQPSMIPVNTPTAQPTRHPSGSGSSIDF